VVLATTVAIVWVVVGVALVGTLVFEAVTLSDDDCLTRAPGDVGEATWQLWPPGSRCHTTISDLYYRGPTAWRGWVLVVEVVVGLGLLVWWRRQRNAPDPDWTA
jgi:hypothetical protein